MVLVAGAAKVAVQVAVESLLAFLRVKGGVGPNALGLDIAPVMDVTDFYGAQSVLGVAQSSAAGAVTGNFVGTASQNPRRYLAIAGEITLGAAAGTVLSMRLSLVHPDGTVQTIGTQFINPTTAAFVYPVVWNLSDVIIPAGTAPRIDTWGDAGGADHVRTLRYTYQRLDGLP